jgi:hypothetical protein
MSICEKFTAIGLKRCLPRDVRPSRHKTTNDTRLLSDIVDDMTLATVCTQCYSMLSRGDRPDLTYAALIRSFEADTHALVPDHASCPELRPHVALPFLASLLTED